MTDLVSRVYRPSPAKCCEACAFGAGAHETWCPVGQALRAEGHHHDDFLQRHDDFVQRLGAQALQIQEQAIDNFLRRIDNHAKEAGS